MVGKGEAMIAEITVNVGFCRYVGSDAKENCDKCSFSNCGLCVSTVQGFYEQCGYGIRGYYVFNDRPKGRVYE
jgi:hypothetical protein